MKKAGENTVRKAWDIAHQEDIRSLVASGKPIQRGYYSHLSPEVYDKICEQLLKKIPAARIAKNLTIGLSTVYREKARLDR